MSEASKRVILDKQGRVHIPVSYLRKLKIVPDEPITVRLDGNRIVLTAIKSKCVICGNEHNITNFTAETFLCCNCRKAIVEQQEEF